MTDYSIECLAILKLLKKRRNVLLTGPPGCGKSRLLSEVAHSFLNQFAVPQPSSVPILRPSENVPIPRNIMSTSTELQTIWPAANKSDRKVFRTVFHQQTKHRDFITGLSPLTNGESGFMVVQGTLYRASEHAKSENGASLLIIDEINRGPAVQVFGGSIAAIESEKRLKSDNLQGINTQFFELLNPEDGTIIEYALPEDLYILAAMNQADTSVEPLDVAFLRRWASYRIEPNYELLRNHYNVQTNPEETLPDECMSASIIYEAAIRALQAINKRIRYGKGKEFQIGHGVLMVNKEVYNELNKALEEIVEVWGYIYEHIEEVFFGDVLGIAVVLNAITNEPNHPIQLEEITFGGEPRLNLLIPTISISNIYSLLKAISEE